MSDVYLTNEQARGFLRVDATTLYRMVHRSNIPVRKKLHPVFTNRFLYHKGDLIKVHIARSEGSVPTRFTPQFPEFNTFFRLTGDFMIIADAHCPLIDWELFNESLYVKDKRRIGKLIIAGDTLNCSAFSRFHSVVRIEWEVERKSAHKFLTECAKEYDEVYILTANHEMRYLLKLWLSYSKRILTHGEELDVWKTATADMKEHLKDKVKFSIYPYCHVNEDEKYGWRITHPKKARKDPMSFAREMAAKHFMNIISTHAHQSGWCFAANSDVQLISCGVFADPLLFDYINLNETAHYKWSETYVVLQDNQGFPYRKGCLESVVH